MMKAAVLYGREDVRIESVDRPRPEAGEVLLRNRVALTCGTDFKVYRRGYHARMIVPPALFGHEVAGVIEEVGPGVVGIEPGMPVVVANSAPCDRCEYCCAGRPNLCDDLLFWNGAYAEFSRIPARIVQKNLLPLGPTTSLRAAALAEPLACVLRGVDDSGIAAGQWVAIIGAGAIGLMFAALARIRGARVVVVGRRPERLARARRLGAVVVAAGRDQDLAEQILAESPGGRGFQVVVEAVGIPETWDVALRTVRKGGVVNLFAGCPAGVPMTLDPQRLHYEEVTLKATFHHTPQAMREALRLVATREIDAETWISGEEPLERLPDVLAGTAEGRGGLKTAILPWGPPP